MQKAKPGRRLRPGPSRVVSLLILPLVLSSCTIKLISDYDEQIDTAATELQQSMDRHLSALKTATDRSYAPHVDFYVEYGVAVRSVRVRAASHEKNRISIEQYDLMLENLETLRALHESQDTLSDGFIDTVIDQFNLAWTTIITLEVAKRRGGDQ